MMKICFFYLWYFILSFTTCLWFLKQRLGKTWKEQLKYFIICIKKFAISGYIYIYIFIYFENSNFKSWQFILQKRNVAINIYWVSRVHSSCISTVYWPQCKCLLKRSLIRLKHTLIFVASRVIEAFEILFESINKIFSLTSCNSNLFIHTQEFLLKKNIRLEWYEYLLRPLVFTILLH